MENIFNMENLSDKVTIFIREKIFCGEYDMGDRLLEQDLADELGVSRAPVREAIKNLVNQGLLVSIPNKGTYVEKINKKDVKEIFEIRVYLESRIIEELIKKDLLKQEDLKNIKNKNIDKSQKALKDHMLLMNNININI